MGLLALGAFLGSLITLGIYELFGFRKNNFEDDVYEQTLKELQASFEDLESKQTDLNLQLEQMRDILKNSLFNDLLKAKDRLDTLVEEFKLEKQSSRETSKRLFSDLYLLKENMKYIPKDENTY